MSEPIRFNSRSHDYRWLSNFYPCDIWLSPTLRYPSLEHAYQAAKCTDPSEAAWIRRANNGAEAKARGRKVQKRADWEQVKLQKMAELLELKFMQHTELRKALLATGDRPLLHEAPWDSYWGTGKDGRGQNKLGGLLMMIRSRWQEAQATLETDFNAGKEKTGGNEIA